MPPPIRFKAFRDARRRAHLLLFVLLPALILGCDSFGPGSSGLSLTADVSSISPSDSTVTLTLRNGSPSPVAADFLCGTFMQRKVNGTWDDWRTTNTTCAFISPVINSASTSSKLSYRPPLIAPGESQHVEAKVREDLGDATAIRFQVWVEYQSRSFRLQKTSKSSSIRSEKTTSNASYPAFPDEERYDGYGYLITEEIPVSR